MTHRLLLLRHAKSSWDDVSVPDHERSLARRGHRAADRMGRYIRSGGLDPDLILCSSARRTRETLERLGLEGADVRIEEGLYAASDDELLARVREIAEEVGSALVLGHNPGVHDLAIDLTGADLGDDAARVREKFPTGALAVFDTDGSWRELGRERARLVSFVIPRGLP